MINEIEMDWYVRLRSTGRFTRKLVSRYLFLLFPVLLSIGSVRTTLGADELPAESFPRILTLSKALQMLGGNSPSQLATKAEIAATEARLESIESQRSLSASLGLDIRTVDRIGTAGHDFLNDSRALLILDKPLFDFGKDASLKAAVELDLKSLSQNVLIDDAAIRIALMTAFFEVILADYAYAYIDEEMTLSYLNFDDARGKMENYQEIAEVEVRKLESDYLSNFSRRTAAGHQQRASRLRLALALNRIDAYPDQLVEPDLSAYDREAPDYDTLLTEVLESNFAIRSAQLKLDAEKQRLSSITLLPRPVLGARFQAAEFRQTMANSRDQFRASIYLDIPLNRRSRDAGEVSLQQAKVLQQEANISLLNHQIRTDVLELVQRIGSLQTEIAAAKSELLYSELNLDKVRLQYEMEVRARIGSANAGVARAIHRLARTRYQHALAWEKLDGLAGKPAVNFN